MTNFSKKKIISQASSGGGISPADLLRITNLENNEYKVTYYEIISGASGSLTVPTGATINAGEFGLSGNAVLSKINGSNKPTFETPTTSGGALVTASLNTVTGAWVASGVYTDPFVALIYSVRIKAVDYVNLNYNNIIETINNNGDYVTLTTIQTLTNKRIVPRVVSTTSSATLTFNVDTTDVHSHTAQAAALTIAAPTGTPNDKEIYEITVTNNGTANTLTFNPIFVFDTLDPAPPNTINGKALMFFFQWFPNYSHYKVIGWRFV